VIVAPQVVGIVLVVLGGALAIWCVLAFATLGRGTPAPFDPPRLLVVRGPYRYVRNPMYLGAAIALAGASLFYESIALACFTVLFLLTVHAFVMLYEEPVLRRKFGGDYADYCAKVRRWW
jgi:protein-S-isoprenylcysteine O-methyltransferase Ste14